MPNLARISDRIAAMVDAFRSAEYIVDTPNGPVSIQVGQTTPTLDRLLNGQSWAVITAYNPDGRLREAKDNAATQRTLEQNLRQLQPSVLLKVCNHDPAGHWPDEPAWLFTPGRISEADLLAGQFGQRALLIGHPGTPAQLRVYSDRIEYRNDASASTVTVVS